MEFGFEFHTQNGIGILNSKNGRNSKLNSKTQNGIQNLNSKNGIQNGIHFKCDMEYEIRKKKKPYLYPTKRPNDPENGVKTCPSYSQKLFDFFGKKINLTPSFERGSVIFFYEESDHDEGM